jgi:hypothetical protein
MHKLVISGLLVMLFLGVSMSLCANTEEGGFGMESSSTPSNIIDHLPFTINTTDVYYIAKDLTVNGDGITVLANNTVLIGQRHTITGNSTGIGVGINASGAVVTDCGISNFECAIRATDRVACLITHNQLCNNTWGILLDAHYPYEARYTIKGNMIIGNRWGLVISGGDSTSRIYNNYLGNTEFNIASSGASALNTTRVLGANMISGIFMGGNYWHDYIGQDMDGDGLGDTDLPYNQNGHTSPGGDYLPLVDIIPPHHDLKTFNFSSPSVSLGIRWKDNVQIDKVVLELDGINYTNSAKVSESFGFNEYYQVEHKVTYASFFILPVGPHTYRWYANDTRNQWNSTQLQSFDIIETCIDSIDISSTLQVTANITCQGAGNITEVIDTVDLEFSIDGSWYSKAMVYSQSTKLYSALIPEYNQLANKTILIYVVAKTKQNQFLNSDVYIYSVPQWVQADINRDGKVTILDIVKATSQYGKP